MWKSLIETFSFDRPALLNLIDRKLDSLNLKEYPLLTTFENDVGSGQVDPEFLYFFGPELHLQFIQLVAALKSEEEIFFDMKFLELGIHTEAGKRRVQDEERKNVYLKEVATKLFTLVDMTLEENRSAPTFTTDADLLEINSTSHSVHEPTGRFLVNSFGKIIDTKYDRVVVREMIRPPQVLFPVRIGNFSYFRTNDEKEGVKILNLMARAMESNDEEEEWYGKHPHLKGTNPGCARMIPLSTRKRSNSTVL